MSGIKGHGGQKGRSGRRPFSVEYERAKLKDSSINKAWKIVENKLSEPIPDKTALNMAGNIALRDLGNDKTSPPMIDARQIHITKIDNSGLKDSINKIEGLSVNKVIDVEVCIESKTGLNLSPTPFSSRDDDI